MRRALATLLASLSLSACGSEATGVADGENCATDLTSPPQDTASDLVLRPAQVSAGERFKATFTDAKARDSILWLSVRTEGGCVRTFYSAGRNSVPEWEEVTDADQFSVVGRVVRGKVVPGIVPPVAPEGIYEVCGGGVGASEICGRLVVAD